MIKNSNLGNNFVLNRYFKVKTNVCLLKKVGVFLKIKQYKKANGNHRLVKTVCLGWNTGTNKLVFGKKNYKLNNISNLKKISFIKKYNKGWTPNLVKLAKTDSFINFSTLTSSYKLTGVVPVNSSLLFKTTFITINNWVFLSLFAKNGHLTAILKSLVYSLNKEKMNDFENLLVPNLQQFFFINSFEGYIKDKNNFASNIKSLVFLSFFTLWNPAVSNMLNIPKKEWKELKIFNVANFSYYDAVFFKIKDWVNSIPLSLKNRALLSNNKIKFLPTKTNFQNSKIINELFINKYSASVLINKLRKNKVKSFIQGRNYWNFTFLRFYKNKIKKGDNLSSMNIAQTIWNNSNQNSFFKVINRKMLKFRKFLWKKRFIWSLNKDLFKKSKIMRVLFRKKVPIFIQKDKESTYNMSLKSLVYLLNKIEDKIDCLKEGENQKRFIYIYNLIKQIIFKKTQTVRLKQSLLIKKRKLSLKKRRWRTFFKKSVLNQINSNKNIKPKTLIFVKKLLEKLSMNKKSRKVLTTISKKYKYSNSNLKVNFQNNKMEGTLNSLPVKNLKFKVKVWKNIAPLLKRKNNKKKYKIIKQILIRRKVNITFLRKINQLKLKALKKKYTKFINARRLNKKQKVNKVQLKKKGTNKLTKNKKIIKSNSQNKTPVFKKNKEFNLILDKRKKLKLKYKKKIRKLFGFSKNLKSKWKNYNKRGGRFSTPKRKKLIKKNYKFKKLSKIVKVDDQYSHILKNQNALTLMYNKRINFFFVNALAYAKYTYNLEQAWKKTRKYSASKFLERNDRYFINTSKYIGIYIKDFVRVGFISMLFKNLTFLVRFIAFLITVLPRNRRETAFLKYIGKTLKKFSALRNEIEALRFKFKGRVNKWRRTKYVIAKRKFITFSTFNKRILHATTHAITRKGTLGVHLWIQYNSSFKHFTRPKFGYIYNNLIRQSFPMYIKYSIRRLKLLKHYKPLIRKFYSNK